LPHFAIFAVDLDPVVSCSPAPVAGDEDDDPRSMEPEVETHANTVEAENTKHTKFGAATNRRFSDSTDENIYKL